MIKNFFSGKFLVIEGIDGAGKSTQARLLFEFLKEKNKNVYLTSEPSDSEIGILIKKFLKGKEKISAKALQLLFCADRALHLEREVLPRLKRGAIVICDRYFFSTIAYGSLEIKDFKWLISLNKKFLLPDLTFLLKVSPKVAISRMKKERKFLSLFEKEKKLKAVNQNYLKLAKIFPKVVVIDGEKSIENVFSKIKEKVFSFILKK